MRDRHLRDRDKEDRDGDRDRVERWGYGRDLTTGMGGWGQGHDKHKIGLL